MALRKVGLFFIGLCLLSGCAKVPGSASGTDTKRLVFTVRLDQAINPNYVYIVAFYPTTEINPTTTGPIPVISPPWGNGFVAGNCRYFMRWDGTQSPRYQIYKFVDANLINYVATGVPVNYEDVENGGKVLRFEIDLTDISETLVEAQSYNTVQVNLLTMDRVPQGNSGDKFWDALGNSSLPSGLNQFINVDVRTSRTYSNSSLGNIEPVGDIADPSLDLSDFTIEVRT